MSCGPGTFEMAFNATNPEAAAWARANGATLVRDIAAESRLAVRNTISRAISEGIAPKQSASLIREIVGLTDAQAQAVMNLRLKAVEGGMSAEQAARRAERYAGKLHKRRALTIARTETMKAANEGQRQLWKQAQGRGYLPPSVRRVWLTTPIEACPVCVGLNKTTATLDGQFPGGFDGPPAHPNCRCGQGIAAAPAAA